MDQALFDVCYNHYMCNFTKGENWITLAAKYGYPTGELLRQTFKRERKRKNIPARNTEFRRPTSKCKILLYDLEVSPTLALVWDIWNQNINTDFILQDWHIIAWSAKWLFEEEIYSDILTPEEAKEHNDKRIVKSIWKLLNEADVVMGHNSLGYDNKRINTRFLFHNMPPPLLNQNIDTLSEARRTFNFTSNKLDYINKYLGLSQKTEHDLDLWKRCWFGDPEALTKMVEYNKNDVLILEDLFLRMRPYIKGVANLNLWDGENISICPSCGSPELNWDVKSYYTAVNRYPAFRCKNCGYTGRSKNNNLSVEKRKTIVR